MTAKSLKTHLLKSSMHKPSGNKMPISIMGILNTTPDSFSDGGSYTNLETSLNHAQQLIADGATIIDIGGESSRPGAQPVALEEELRRTIPIITALRLESDVTISIDTVKAEVARQALAAGADIINDISALSFDPQMVEVLCDSDADVVLMHMQGSPATMQDNPQYQNITEELLAYFSRCIENLDKRGVNLERIIVDPGIGFGKKLEHNLSLFKDLDRFQELGARVLLGHSRKSFLGTLTQRNTGDRDQATAICSALCADRGIDIIRVHNVRATRDALTLARALS